MIPIPTRKLGRTGLDVTVLGLGGAPLGDFSELIPDDRARATVDTAYQAGIRLYDTSPLYGHGLSEHRFGGVLRNKQADDIVLSTKVGRWLKPEKPERIQRGSFKGGLNFEAVYDYSYDGCMRSLEQSYQRLGMNRIDIVLIHDVDISTHGTREAYERRFGEAMEGCYRALTELRSAGIIRAIGAGLNEVEPSVRFAQAGDFDCFLLAGRYTLLEQNGLDDLLPLAVTKRFSILIGGPYNSGILATGAVPGAKYNYRPAPADVMERVARIEKTCIRHSVSIAAAAIQFPLGHPSVASVVPGAVRPEEVARNTALMATPVPAALWDELKNEDLLDKAAPVPGHVVR